MVKRSLRVLHVEDSERDVVLIQHHLSQAGYELIFDRVDTLTAMQASLRSKEWDVILCDYAMPRFGAMEALALLQESGLSIPFIIISGTIGEETAVQAILTGANDYLMKANLRRLVPAIERELQEAESRRERQRLEAALRESEDRYRDLVEHSHDLISTHDLQGQILSVNQAAIKLLGYDLDNLLNRNIREFLLPKFRNGFADYIAELQKNGSAQGLITLYTHTGEKRTWEYFNTLRTEGVAAPVVRGVAHDVTERRKAEAALKQSEERYRDLVENARDIIYSHDLEGNYTSVNKACEQITGYSREEALAMNQMRTLPPEYLEKARQMMAKKLAGGEETIYDLEIIAKDGSRIAVEVNTRLIFQNGVAVGVQGIARDITERRLLEDELRQAQKMEAVGQLASGIAHDFNNLITAINGYSDLTLMRVRDQDPLRSNLKEIKKAGDRAAALTRQLLAFSRKQVLEVKILDLNSLVLDIEKMLRRLIGEDINLQTRLHPQLGNIKADPGQIEQVIMNLVVNARDAMPRGGKLTFETGTLLLEHEYTNQHFTLGSGSYVSLTVSDTGIGMDDKTLAHIFDPFFTTKEKSRGTGLGLSTVYGIVKQSGGGIWVDSEVGRGTTFKIYLPCIDEQVQTHKPSVQMAAAISGKETILLAEDEEIIRKLVSQILNSYGYEVLEAPNGKAALLLCERHKGPLHMLLTDVIMPEMSGSHLSAHLTGLHPEMKVLYMSGYTNDAIAVHGVLEDGINFIQKPFLPEDLARKVREVLDS